MATYQIPGVKARLDGAPTAGGPAAFATAQPGRERFDAPRQAARYQVAAVAQLRTEAPTIPGSLDWIQQTVDVVWT